MTTFGSVIKQLREDQDIGLRELARKVGVAPAYIHDIEKLRRNAPSKDVIRKLASVLSFDEERLFDLAVNGTDRIPHDIQEIIKRHPESVNLLRSIQKNQISTKHTHILKNLVKKQFFLHGLFQLFVLLHRLWQELGRWITRHTISIIF